MSRKPQVGDIWKCIGESGASATWRLDWVDGEGWWRATDLERTETGSQMISLGRSIATGWSLVRAAAVVAGLVYCHGTKDYQGMSINRLRAHVARTYRAWPRCDKHGVDLEVVEYDRDRAALRCPKMWE